jgi:hypothetical protein
LSGYGILRFSIVSSNWVTDVLAVAVSALSLLPLFKARRLRNRALPVITVSAVDSTPKKLGLGERTTMQETVDVSPK